MTTVVALLNQKGGVGKTTLTLGLAVALTDAGRRVLVVDLDPQANATDPLLPAAADLSQLLTTNDVLASAAEGVAADAITPTGWDGIDLIPAELALAARDGESVTLGDIRLRRTLRGATDPYDVVLIDCPPALGSLSVNALVAADQALLVTEPALASVRGVGEVLRTIDQVLETNQGLHVAGIILNKGASTREAQQRGIELEAAYGPHGTVEAGLLWHPYVPAATAFSEAYGAHVPVQRFPSPRQRELTAVLAKLAEHLMEES